jgi:phosphoribosyl-AMP cyclohydrolase
MAAAFTDPTSLSRATLETGATFAPRFDADGLIPAIAQDAASGEVLMLAYMNADALAQTLATGEAHYWSRSRRELWHKGATSGQTQTVLDLRTDCDQDTILLRVQANGDGGCCHVGYRSCFYRKAEDADHLAQTDVPKL